MSKPINVLFVTWDGPESSYLEGLFLPIFSELSARGFNCHILQFTWGDKERRHAIKNFCDERRISYRAVSVIRKPLSIGALASAIFGARAVRAALNELEIEVVISRSTLPAFASILALRRFPTVQMIFDADGLPHDERVDFSGWSPNGGAYRLLRDLEALAIRRASAVLTRSRKAVEILLARAGAGTTRDKFLVVSNGRDENLFRPVSINDRNAVRSELGITSSAPLIVFVGSSIEGKYCGREMLQFFRIIQRRSANARMLLLMGSPPELDKLLVDFEDIRSSCIAMRVSPTDVAYYLSAADLGLAFIRPSFSMQAAAAIKVGEYLLCGLPTLTTRAIGDTDEILSDGIGHAMNELSLQDMEVAAEWFFNIAVPDMDGFRARCRQAGVVNFGLHSAVAKYESVIGGVFRAGAKTAL
jgi:hypothetical protein